MTSFVRNFEALDATEPYDVCIVGTGIAGTLLAVELVRRALRVLLVESASSSDADQPGTPQKDTPGGPGRAGRRSSSPVWQGICERLDPADFRVHPYTRRSNPWPICYADLEPHYRAAEQAFRVRQTPPAPAWRLPRSAYKHADPAFAALLRRHGIDAKGVARATPGTGRSVFTTSRELLPEFVAARTGTLVSGVTATRLRTDGHGRVIGAVCRTPDGAGKTARAHTYVLAAGALDTPRLLLLSQSQRFPRGLGNDFGRVGRGYTDHAVIAAHGSMGYLGRRPPRPVPLHTEQFHNMFRRDGLGAVHPFFERHGLLAEARRFFTDEWAARLADVAGRREAFSLTCRIEMLPADENRVLLAPTSLDAFGDPTARLIFDYSEQDLELIARTRAWLARWLDRLGVTRAAQREIEWAGTPSGTCRMGADPRSSVCDANLRVHSSPNLYICGAETFPRSGAVPPALTVAALAHRLAEHIAARARWCARATVRPKRAPAPTTVATPIPLVRRRPQP